MTRRVGSPKGAKAKADKYFSLLVRARGACQACGESDYTKLQCAHILSRRFSNTRCDERNALALCAKDHHWFTDHPVSFGQFVIDLIGVDLYDELVALAHSMRKVDWPAVAADLEAQWKQAAA